MKQTSSCQYILTNRTLPSQHQYLDNYLYVYCLFNLCIFLNGAQLLSVTFILFASASATAVVATTVDPFMS